MAGRRHLQIVTSDGKVVEDTCHHRTRQLRRVDDLHLDRVEQIFLKLFRELCTDLFSETPEAISASHARVVQQLGEPHGSQLIYNSVDLVYAIRSERSGEFSYMPAECPVCSRRLSDEEWITLMLIRAARRGDDADLLTRAQTLTEGSISIGVALAAKVLAAQLEDIMRGETRGAAGQHDGMPAGGQPSYYAKRSGTAEPTTCD